MPSFGCLRLRELVVDLSVRRFSATGNSPSHSLNPELFKSASITNGSLHLAEPAWTTKSAAISAGEPSRDGRDHATAPKQSLNGTLIMATGHRFRVARAKTMVC